MNCPVDHVIPEDKCWVCVQVEKDKITLALLEAAREALPLVMAFEGTSYRHAEDLLQKAIALAEGKP